MLGEYSIQVFARTSASGPTCTTASVWRMSSNRLFVTRADAAAEKSMARRLPAEGTAPAVILPLGYPGSPVQVPPLHCALTSSVHVEPGHCDAPETLQSFPAFAPAAQVPLQGCP